MPYERITRDVWRVEVCLPLVPGGRRIWIHMADVETKEEADEFSFSFRYRTRFRIKRREVGGHNKCSGRRKKQPYPTMAEASPMDSGAF